MSQLYYQKEKWLLAIGESAVLPFSWEIELEIETNFLSIIYLLTQHFSEQRVDRANRVKNVLHD